MYGIWAPEYAHRPSAEHPSTRVDPHLGPTLSHLGPILIDLGAQLKPRWNPTGNVWTSNGSRLRARIDLKPAPTSMRNSNDFLMRFANDVPELMQNPSQHQCNIQTNV